MQSERIAAIFFMLHATFYRPQLYPKCHNESVALPPNTLERTIIMKKIIPALLSLSLTASLCLPALAATPLSQPPANQAAAPSGYAIEINGADTDIQACIMVPLRAVAEELGFTVSWSGDQVRVDTGKVHTDVTIGVDRYVVTTSLEGMVGMSAPFSLGCAPYATNGTTYVPLGLFDALLGNREDAITGDSGTISIQTDPAVQIPNPFVDCATLAEAKQQAGFPLTLPDTCRTDSISVLPGSMIQGLCTDGLSVRKGMGDADVSGDYTAYPQVETVSMPYGEITLKGTGGQVQLAVWTADGYTYAIRSEAGLDRDTVLELAGGVI